MKSLLTLLALALSLSVFPQAMDNFTPSTVSPGQLGQLFDSLKGGNKPGSQCFNRAHYWSWQLDSGKKVKTFKIFMFFRKEFMNIDSFDWWFHVAPAVLVEGEREPMVLDKYLWNGPVPLSYWQTHFLRMGGSDRHACKKIDKYSDYVNNTYNEHCYIYFAAPTYWQPRELEKLETLGTRKSPEWNRSEVNTAKKQAFWF